MFESVWNAGHIDHITVGAYEQIRRRGQGGNFYERLVRSVNFPEFTYCKLLALVTMGQPRTLTSEEIHHLEARSYEVNLVRSTRKTRSGASTEATAKEIHNLDSSVETFAKLTLSIDNERWQEPITIETGKGLERETTFDVSFP